MNTKRQGPIQTGLFHIPHVKSVCVHEAEVMNRCCQNPEDVCRIWKETVASEPAFDPEKEHFVVLFLNTKNRLKSYHVVSVGTLTSALVHPREVFRPAIVQAASSVVVAHNHPSGDPAPSSADIQVTRQLREAGRLIGIEVMDHIIVGDPGRHSGSGFYSFREAGLL